MYPEHLKTFDYLGLHQYFLTFCTHERHRLFEKADAVSLVRTQIERAATAVCSNRVLLSAFTTRQHSAIACGSDMDTSTSSAAMKLL
jgi:hypothetical protein